MTWLEDVALRDLDPDVVMELSCQCGHTWTRTATQLLINAEHRDMYLDEVGAKLGCTRPHCTRIGMKLTVTTTAKMTPFIGGMP